MNIKASKVIFVGSFLDKAKDGSVGGQMFACNSLMKSKLAKEYDFILIDSTADSVPAPPIRKRLKKVAIRFVLFIKGVFKTETKTCLIFCSAGFSIVEKGLMVLIGKLFRKKVILAPRSGLVKEDIKKPFLKWYISFIVRKADVVICQGKEWKLFYEELSGEKGDKFFVQQNWIDAEPYITNNPTYVVKKSGDELNLLYLGWLEEYKGIFDLIEAIHLLDKSSLKFKLLVFGAGKSEKKAKQLVEDYSLQNFIYFKGWADYQQKLYVLKSTDIFILPSHFEGSPNALLEAMASQLPVIATKVGAIPEIIIDRFNGLLVEKQNIAELSEKIFLLLSDPKLRVEMANNARNTVLKNNSIEIVSEKFIHLISSQNK
jgi:glycosyltransferase involved in cell wall biosynthesis